MLGAVNKLNLGCGSVIFREWDNCDKDVDNDKVTYNGDLTPTRVFRLNVLQPDAWWYRAAVDHYDYIFCNHMLSDIGHHDLVLALENIRGMLRDGGKVRILVPDIIEAFKRWEIEDDRWFPQGDDLDLEAKFCTFVTWFGESKSVFTRYYLLGLGKKAGFSVLRVAEWGEDIHDDRKGECFVVEFTK